MVRIGLPSGFIAVVGLMAPCGPALPDPAPEQLHIRSRRTRLDEVVLLIGLTRVLALPSLNHVYLTAAGGKRAGVFAANAEQDDLGHIAKIKTDPATVRAAILSDLVPNDI